jgi:hypothetical protein
MLTLRQLIYKLVAASAGIPSGVEIKNRAASALIRTNSYPLPPPNQALWRESARGDRRPARGHDELFVEQDHNGAAVWRRIDTVWQAPLTT